MSYYWDYPYYDGVDELDWKLGVHGVPLPPPVPRRFPASPLPASWRASPEGVGQGGYLRQQMSWMRDPQTGVRATTWYKPGDPSAPSSALPLIQPSRASMQIYHY